MGWGQKFIWLVNMLFNKVLRENENDIFTQNRMNFWATNIQVYKGPKMFGRKYLKMLTEDKHFGGMRYEWLLFCSF